MKKPKIYIDTSVINFLFAEDAPDFRRATLDFFEYHAARYELFVSRVVIEEIEQTPNADHRRRLLQVIDQYAIAEIRVPDEQELGRLVKEYLNRGIFPPGKINDALHVAYAVAGGLDILISWNFKHLANLQKEARIVAANLELGYRYPLRIVSPLEVEDEFV
jgi:predicted nucleic acid-binding protein